MRYLFTLTCLLFATTTLADESEFDFESNKAKAAVQKYQDASRKSNKRNLDSLIRSLEAAFKHERTDGDFEEAIKIRDAIKSLKKGDGLPSDSTLTPKKGRAKSSIDGAMGETSLPWKTQRKHLIGTWKWFNHTATFHDNGAVTSTFGNSGTWKRDNERVVITWKSKTDGIHHWDSFDFPIDPNGVIGDSWMRPGMIRSKKIK